MLPPPTTMPTCTPLRTTSAICRAMLATVTGSMPSFSPPANASPDSFSRTRFQVIRSGADLEAGETLQRDAGLVEHRLHRFLVVAYVGLVEEDDLLEEARHAAFDDLRQRLLGLAFFAGRGLGDAPLVLDDVRRDIVASEVLRAQRRDLHCDTARRLDVIPVELDENADGRRQVTRASVHVGRDLAVEHRDAAELELLADGRSKRLDVLRHRLAVGERLGEERVAVTLLRRRRMRDDVVGELQELLVLRDEVRLAVELDDGAFRSRHQAGARGALSTTLLDLRGVLHPQDLSCLVEVAVGFLERSLGVHHPGAGGVAELLYVGSSYSHRVLLSSSYIVVRVGTGPSGRAVRIGPERHPRASPQQPGRPLPRQERLRQ